ncbi:MAG: HRDC domain-containing protein [Prevotella sp.]|nr:HRDC domain-containing protein [Prevotella sp.]MBP3712508.1 HRDC domain-containing protein [Bacteroidaceae bacterium]MBQ9295183.1 HRDC domain-containing protein [Bacteroidaceae bacterium]
MQIKVFTIPLSNAEVSEAEVNAFIRGHRVLQIDRQFSSEGGGYWTLFVEYMEGDPSDKVPPANRRDHRDAAATLTEEQKARYERMKAIRRTIATQESLPAYLVFTNEELAVLAQLPAVNEETTKHVKGIAPKRLGDYVKYFYDTTGDGEAGGKPDGEDSRQGEPE